MKHVFQSWVGMFAGRGDRGEIRRVSIALILAVGALLVLAGPAQAGGGSGGAGAMGGNALGSGALGGGSMGIQGANSGFPGDGTASEMHRYRQELRERHEYHHRYGDGSAELVRDRPDRGLGGPCQPPPPIERPDLDYGHRH